MCNVSAKSPLRITLLALAAAIAAGLSCTVAATAQELEVQGAVWCDKPEQLESVLKRHLVDGMPIEAALAMTNAAVADPSACGAVKAIVSPTGKSRRFVVGDQLMSIAEYTVHGVIKDGQPLKIEALTWYSARMVAKLTAV